VIDRRAARFHGVGMGRIVTGMLAFVLAWSSAGVATAARERGREREPLAALEARARDLTLEARATKGGPRQRLLMHRAALASMIDRVAAGERVDPAEIDRLLADDPMLP
jgi:hypothetical protein